jgi:hypothetical protein
VFALLREPLCALGVTPGDAGRADWIEVLHVFGAPLLFVAARSLTIAFEMFREREGREPGLATNSPQLVGGLELVRRVERSQIHDDLLVAAREQWRPTSRAEMPPFEIARFALDDNRVPRKDCGRVKQRAVVLAAVEAMTDADAIRASRRDDAHRAAQASSSNPLHRVRSRVAVDGRQGAVWRAAWQVPRAFSRYSGTRQAIEFAPDELRFRYGFRQRDGTGGWSAAMAAWSW